MFHVDDLTTPNGAVVTDPCEFGSSWLVSTDSFVCSIIKFCIYIQELSILLKPGIEL